jgi:hypothetical protein
MLNVKKGIYINLDDRNAFPKGFHMYTGDIVTGWKQRYVVIGTDKKLYIYDSEDVSCIGNAEV